MCAYILYIHTIMWKIINCISLRKSHSPHKSAGSWLSMADRFRSEWHPTKLGEAVKSLQVFPPCVFPFAAASPSSISLLHVRQEYLSFAYVQHDIHTPKRLKITCIYNREEMCVTKNLWRYHFLEIMRTLHILNVCCHSLCALTR